MDLKTLLKNDLHVALKKNDLLKKRAIRLLISTIQLAEVAKGAQLNEAEFISTVQKEIKTKNESILDAKKADRPAMVEELESEIHILEQYLPEQLSEADLIDLVQRTIVETGAISVKDIGKVLKVLLPRLAGQASNQDASRIVKDCLSKP